MNDSTVYVIQGNITKLTRLYVYLKSPINALQET